jgi:hypothetical protein
MYGEITNFEEWPSKLAQIKQNSFKRRDENEKIYLCTLFTGGFPVGRELVCP